RWVIASCASMSQHPKLHATAAVASLIERLRLLPSTSTYADFVADVVAKCEAQDACEADGQSVITGHAKRCTYLPFPEPVSLSRSHIARCEFRHVNPLV